LAKKAVIVITLVDEAKEKSNAELEKEIFSELSKEPTKISWMKYVERVTVIENP